MECHECGHVNSQGQFTKKCFSCLFYYKVPFGTKTYKTQF